MISISRLFAVAIVFAAGTVRAQTTLPAPAPDIPDSIARNVVTKFAVRSGKIALSTATNPGPAYLPDGTYTSENSTILVILDGRIVRMQWSSGAINEIASVRVSREGGIVLTPSTNALMTVTDIRLPSGTFKSEDGTASFKVVAARPTVFTLPPAPETR